MGPFVVIPHFSASRRLGKTGALRARKRQEWIMFGITALHRRIDSLERRLRRQEAVMTELARRLDVDLTTSDPLAPAAEERRLVAVGKSVRAVKHHRERTGSRLIEATEAIKGASSRTRVEDLADNGACRLCRPVSCSAGPRGRAGRRSWPPRPGRPRSFVPSRMTDAAEEELLPSRAGSNTRLSSLHCCRSPFHVKLTREERLLMLRARRESDGDRPPMRTRP